MDPLLVVTHAGTGRAGRLGDALEVLRRRTSVEVCETEQIGELDGALHRAGSRPIVVAGGDGSLHAVIATLHRRRDLAGRRLGLLPLGTGNDYARAVGIPLDAAEAAEALLDSPPRPMDLIVDELGEVVVNGVHLGTSALASRSGAVWKQRLGRFGLGALGYPLGAAVTAVRPPRVRLRVEVDGRVAADMDRPVLMVALGNGPTVGGGAPLAPAADPGDGQIDVMIVPALAPGAWAGMVRDLARWRHHRRDDVRYLRGTRVAVSGEEFWLSADGEVSGPERRRCWHVEPGAYQLLAPGQDSNSA